MIQNGMWRRISWRHASGCHKNWSAQKCFIIMKSCCDIRRLRKKLLSRSDNCMFLKEEQQDKRSSPCGCFYNCLQSITLIISWNITTKNAFSCNKYFAALKLAQCWHISLILMIGLAFSKRLQWNMQNDVGGNVTAEFDTWSGLDFKYTFNI